MKSKEKHELEILKVLSSQRHSFPINFTEFSNSLPSLSYDPHTVQDICFELESNGHITLKRKWGKSRELDFIDEITHITPQGSEHLRELKEKYSLCCRLKKFFNNPYVIVILSILIEVVINLWFSS